MAQGRKPHEFARRLKGDELTIKLTGSSLTVCTGNGDMVLTGDARLYRFKRRWWIGGKKAEVRLQPPPAGG